jgi:hypothetical protein
LHRIAFHAAHWSRCKTAPVFSPPAHSKLNNPAVLHGLLCALFSAMRLTPEILAQAKSLGFSDRQIAHLTGMPLVAGVRTGGFL